MPEPRCRIFGPERGEPLAYGGEHDALSWQISGTRSAALLGARYRDHAAVRSHLPTTASPTTGAPGCSDTASVLRPHELVQSRDGLPPGDGDGVIA